MLNRFGLKLIFLLFLTPLCNIRGAAQVAFHNFNSNDGLPSNEIYSEYQDHDGFMWFATDHGIVKYNGYNFRTFTTADGLTDNTVLEIKGDDENRIWVLTLSGGMCFFDGKRFEPHPNNEAIKKLFVKHLPTSWQVLKNKQVWMGFVESGFAKIDSNQQQFFTTNDSLPFYKDSVRIYVLHLASGQYVYTSLADRKMPKVDDPNITSVEVCKVDAKFSRVNFNFLISIRNEKFMCLERFIVFIDSDNICHELELPRNNIILKLRELNDGNIWMLQKNNGCYALNIRNNRITITDSIIFATSATDLLLDHQGNQWISTLNNGVYMLPDKKIRIFAIPGLKLLNKISIVTTGFESLYAGLPEGQLLKIDNELHTSVFSAPKSARSPSAIRSITFKKDGQPQTNSDTSFLWCGDIDFYHTKILSIDGKSTLVGATNGFALLTSGHKVVFASHNLGFNQRVTEICELTPDRYLIGTFTGLYYYEHGIKDVIAEEAYLKDTRITSAKTFKTGLFGVATRGKGIVLNIDGKYFSVDERKGIISDLAEDLYFESDSVVWEASFQGISKIYFKLTGDSLITRVKNYTKDDGLCSNQVNGLTGFNGYIWLATNEGLCYFNPKYLSEETVIIPLYFGNISVNGVKRSADSLILTHDENNIFIEFNALYYKAIQGIRYRVRLKGIGPWKFTDINNIQYFSLPPGEYQFEVAADDRDGKYRSEVHTLNFTIKPRFVDTAWFKLLVGLFILFIIAMVMYAVFSYQKLKSVNIIKLLQAEFKALSYQINPHFIFNVLNSIQYYILKKDTDNAVHLLGSFALLIRRIVNNSRQQYIGIIEEVECLREYMDLEKMRLDNKFEYTINIDCSIDIEEKNILPMIIQPLVENSIWHGIVPSSKPGVISIDFKKENGAVICKVEDNGVGINISLNKEKTQNNLSLAMKNVSERLKIISELNESSWAIKTEDKSVTDPLQSGTIVTIVFPAVKDRK